MNTILVILLIFLFIEIILVVILFSEIKGMKYTCYHCKDKDKCEYAFDDYNTHGDCLLCK